MREFLFLAYLFWPCAVALYLLPTNPRKATFLAVGTSFAFNAWLWSVVTEQTAGNPLYHFPAVHIMYPWICMIVLALVYGACCGTSFVMERVKSHQPIHFGFVD
ncbi:hypothetical protein [Cerasicoccus maritimus]|uniref:hypothetical protein n=1 Tax=Cerasicoccus maritimus TaxID=490089 RepID=UPI002852A6DB|nr:hypothetical protein [Cerasicoccus maritimus]